MYVIIKCQSAAFWVRENLWTHRMQRKRGLPHSDQQRNYATGKSPIGEARIEKRRRKRRQESDGDEGAGGKKERKTEAEVVG